MAGLSKFLGAIPPMNLKAVVATASLGAGIAFYVNRRIHDARKIRDVIKDQKKDAKKKKERAAVDMKFLRRLWMLLRIIIPGVFTPECAYMILVATMMILRTYADVWMIQNGTAIEGSIIGRNFSEFKVFLMKFITAMPIISVVNNLLKYGLNELKLRFRTRLSTHLYTRYMRGFTFYKMANLDNRIANADQLLTQDVEKFCDTLGELYSNVCKPVLDICLYVYQLTESIGGRGPFTMLSYLAVSGLILTRLRSPVGLMTVKEQQLEGKLRYVNSRVITNSEEISFYQGSSRECQTVQSTFMELVDHLRDFILFRFSMGFIDTVIAKYLATVVGYLAVSKPFLDLSDPRHLHSTHNEILLDYYRSGRMLVRMAEAIGRLVLAGREMTRLAG